MSLAPEKIADLRLKHLEVVQAVVTRMAANGATLKNYCITLTTAVCGFAITLQRPGIMLLAFLPLLIFALLDAQYLRLERRFRALFDLVRTGDLAELPSFDLSPSQVPPARYAAALRSWSIVSFYGPLATGVVVVILLARSFYGRLY